ncbi:MAG: valine--tRNA ligase [Gemmatimonadetes bacterium]|nr:valine--tRNA ligase [Gemmatimonadota bacterium]
MRAEPDPPPGNTPALPPQYDPASVERDLYRQWREAGWFRPRGHGEPYVIMMPPPNVTAQLHMGHGLNNSVQDVMIRFERMRGRDCLWLPGTDHAGIATQNVVEKQLAKEGKTRFDLGRDAFEARVKAYADETGEVILRQLESIGCSADWDRTYYTFSDRMSRAVREVFVQLYDEGLIYRGKYIINWCPRCLTALSNEEAEKTEVDGRLWRIRYPLADGTGHIVVATTRPETMLGDTGVAVHPDSTRYRDLVGRDLILPLVGRRIPVVADAAVDPEFGTGAVKLTPAHDPLDFEIARRHDLSPIDVMNPDATMAAAVPEAFRGLDRFEARRRVIEALDAEGMLESVDTHRHAVGHCYRCDTVVEPRLSDQWFVKMAPLAKAAHAAYLDGTLQFVPERRGAEYANWMEGIRDWCISRQLWWGHRIPVWYCDNPRCGATIASRADPDRCPKCRGPLRQDEDVLDTWFSSQLVPFSALGWPDRTPDLARYYPGHALVTAPEILFFWVARMIMAGLKCLGQVPFTTIYLHGTVRDTQHRKMSKSLGNGIDPLEVVDRFGADALRYTVVGNLAVGTDVILDPADLEASFAAGRNFANKLWNVGRFLLSHLPAAVRPLGGPAPDLVHRNELALADRWIIARCDAMVREATAGYQKLRLNDAAAAAYRFLWNDLADWYLEAIKPRLFGEQPGGDVARAVAAQTFDVALRVLHPIMPFITETLWKRLPGRHPDQTIMMAPWPAPDARAVDPRAEAEFGAGQDLVMAIRSIRAEYGVPPGQPVRAAIDNVGPTTQAALRQLAVTVERLAKVSDLATGTGGQPPPTAAAAAILPDGTSLTIPLGDLVDVAKECGRLGQEADRLRQLVGNQEKKLGNEQFISRAPADVVQKERDKLAAWRDQVAALDEKRAQLGCAR